MSDTPILSYKFHDKPSVFQPENLLREARRQKGITELVIPEICILDPDGDIEKYVIHNLNAQQNKAWACYHTKLYEFKHDKFTVGIIGQAVFQYKSGNAPFGKFFSHPRSFFIKG